MHRVEQFRRVLIGGLALLSAAPTAAAAAAAGQPQGSGYKVTAAELDVIEYGNQTTDYGAGWDGNGRHTDSLQAEDEELPPLPVPLIPGRKNSVFVNTDLIREGSESLIEADGSRAECSGSWDERNASGFSVGLKGRKDLVSTWRIETGIASGSCGLVYNLMDDPLKVKGKVNGHIGSDKIVLTARGMKEEREVTSRSTLTQKVNWKGKVVLKEVKPRFRKLRR